MPRNVVSTYSNRPKFGQVVTFHLCAQSKNQKWLAEECSVTQSHMSMVLSGKTNPSTGLLCNIATVLHIEANILVNAFLGVS